MTRDEIQSSLTDILVEMFELDPADVSLEARLYDDLDIDSIDAVDLMVRLKEFTRANIDPDRVKDIRTVADVVDVIEDLLG